jgi:hypothetical protein
LLSMKNFHEAEFLMEWIDSCYDRKLNPSGGAALFNIPDDADNTSMAVGFQLLYFKRFEQPQVLPDTGPLEMLEHFRDCHRTKSDRKNTGLGKESGAFLTWLKDEEQPAFSRAEHGIIPLWANNVDIVINANVLFALSMAGLQKMAGYHEALQLVVKCIDDYSWPHSSLYYPEKYVFPYAVSRAWRDAGVRDPLMDQSMPKLMLQLLDEQFRFGKKNPGMAGAFPWDKFGNCMLATALGLITLLNLGRPVAEKCGSYRQFVLATDKAVQFLVRHRRAIQARQNSTRRQFPAVPPNFWESGVLFTSSLQPLAHWRSHAQATSLVLEAFSKYIIAYDLEESRFMSRRLSLGGNFTIKNAPLIFLIR